MSETFFIYCPSCNSKLNAKPSMIGQTKNCPKCKSPILVQSSLGSRSDSRPSASSRPVAGALPTIPLESSPTPVEISSNPNSVKQPQLDFSHYYFILGLDQVVAVWERSKGWHVNIGAGFGPARSNLSAIPDQGVFAFVEMVMEGGIPKKLNISKISARAAVPVIYRDADAILGKLEEPMELSVAQKEVFLHHLRKMFMSSVLDDPSAGEIISYLTSH